MKHTAYFLIFLLLTSFYACSLSEKEQLKQLEEQVLKEHDVVMSQMDKIYQRQRKLQASLKTMDTTQTEAQLIKNQISVLKNADAAMMDWMHQYKSPADLGPEKARIYLQDQLLKIEGVKIQVTDALANTKK